MSIVPQEQVAAMQQQGDFAIKSSDVAAKLGEFHPTDEMVSSHHLSERNAHGDMNHRR